MKLIILNDYDQVGEWAAKYIRNKIINFNPGPDRFFILGLPTGKQVVDSTVHALLSFVQLMLHS